ncbi:Ribosome biogenesis protein 1 [Kappamyces sp. JEL0680]|nr:Ribosome biogenesis protein 1 [Kappamyces sp. JEL0680]
MKIARAIRAGIIVPGRKQMKKAEKPKFYDIWANSEGQLKANHIAAPKLKLPEHMESYNPPAEYLLDDEEEKEWKALDPEDRPHNFLPKIHKSLRQVAAYPRFIQERFERCLDLYLAPRAIKQKMDVDPESLIPRLPSPKDLRPFPTKLSIVFKGHSGRIRALDVDPSGQWLASGSDDSTLKIWEIASGRCVNTISFGESVMAVAWNPNRALSLVAVAVGTKVCLVKPGVGIPRLAETTEEIAKEALSQVDEKKVVEWGKPSTAAHANVLLELEFKKAVSSVIWHRKGDYFATVCPDANSSAVQLHQLSKGASQNPFKKSLGIVQKVIFHPSRPFLFVATQRSVRVYNLIKQELIRKLIPGSQWISSIDIHPGGDNIIIGTFDKRIHWFDMDLSAKPYKTLRYHTAAVRQVAFHPRYPLFASSSDDGSVLLFHGMVYGDLMQNPLIVPVKTLKSHEVVGSLGVLDIVWHPAQPWVFSCGADKQIKLFI